MAGANAVSTSAEGRRAQTTVDLLQWCSRLGDIAADRILAPPEPGSATIDDLLRAESADQLCELIDGTLVRKAMGRKESVLAGILIRLLNDWVLPRRLGEVSGEAGGYRFAANLVRMPDVAFTSRERLRKLPQPEPAYPYVVPDMAVEILSRSNTAAEMARKVGDYFSAGVRLVWLVDRFQLAVTAYTAPEDFRILTAADVLDGGDVLPGFSIRLADWFVHFAESGGP